jgi:Carboxypeptidase regulatory-like domain
VGRRPFSALVILTALAIAGLATSCGGDDGDGVADVPYSDVQAVFDGNGCTGCHPGVNPSLDLTAENSYDELVGIEALEDPTLYRVVAGDPERSFLYLKIGGNPAIADIPAIGTRMPPRAPPISAEDMETVRNWILGGAKGPDGTTGGPEVTTPGSAPTGLGDAAVATRPKGTGAITGTVVGQDRRPIEGAFVTLLLTGSSLEGGEEHLRVATTDADGRFMLDEAPAGRFLLKAYAPSSIYVSRIVALDEGETEEIQFGLPNRVVVNPVVSGARVDGLELSMDVQGSNLDGNYTLAVNPEAGITVELHSPNNAPGRWSAVLPRAVPGSWVFLAVDEQCNVSEFLPAGS